MNSNIFFLTYYFFFNLKHIYLKLDLLMNLIEDSYTERSDESFVQAIDIHKWALAHRWCFSYFYLYIEPELISCL